jgi:hypothetical protein
MGDLTIQKQLTGSLHKTSYSRSGHQLRHISGVYGGQMISKQLYEIDPLKDFPFSEQRTVKNRTTQRLQIPESENTSTTGTFQQI